MNQDIVISVKQEDGTYKDYEIDFVWVSFPGGQTGYRLEYTDPDLPYPVDLGTLTIDKDGKKAVIIQW